jgi:hypothetical protein
MIYDTFTKKINKTMNTALENQNIEMNQQCQAARKRIPSRLDAFAPQLLQMERETKTLPQILDWLKERDVTTSASNLSHFLQRRREEAERHELQQQLESRANKCRAFKEWFAGNPTLDLGTVIEMFKQLMLELGAKKEADPELLKLADKLAGTAIRFVNAQSREAYRTRKLVMEEAKHAEWVKCERTRAFELCLDEAKKYPVVTEMYRAAFAALEKCQKENGE